MCSLSCSTLCLLYYSYTYVSCAEFVSHVELVSRVKLSSHVELVYVSIATYNTNVGALVILTCIRFTCYIGFQFSSDFYSVYISMLLDGRVASCQLETGHNEKEILEREKFQRNDFVASLWKPQLVLFFQWIF